MMFKKTVGEIRSDVDQHAEELRAEMERVATVLTFTLVACALIVGFAVIYASGREEVPRS